MGGCCRYYAVTSASFTDRAGPPASKMHSMRRIGAAFGFVDPSEFSPLGAPGKTRVMNRFSASLAVAAIWLAAPAGAAGAAGPTQDLVSGTGKGEVMTGFGPFFSHVHLNAKGDAAHAHGRSWGRFFDTSVGDVATRGSVFCVNADGNEAIVGTITTRSNTSFVPVGSRNLWKVVDNGQGRHDPPDRIGVFSFPPLASCPAPALVPVPTGPIERGNFVVKDGA